MNIFKNFTGLMTLLLVAVVGLVTGCVSSGFSARPDNVHRAVKQLPENVRRVAVLPLARQADDPNLFEGCEVLTPVVYEELTKTKKFEVVQVQPDVLRNLSGQASWAAEEMLPADFLKQLQKKYGCDAVLFSELTTFKPYAPVAVGWRFKLVDVHSKTILWAADEAFKANKPSVSAAVNWVDETLAGFYQTERDNWTDLHSPGRVGRESAASLLATLPAR